MKTKCLNEDCGWMVEEECWMSIHAPNCEGRILSVDEKQALSRVDSQSAGSVSSTVIEIKDPDLLSRIKEMFNDAEEALRLAVETRLASDAWKNSQKRDVFPKC